MDLTGIPIISFSPDLSLIIENHPRIESLILAECSLCSLDNFPTLPNLTNLDLSSNFLSDRNIEALLSCKAIVKLNLADNKIENAKSLSPFRRMQSLTSLNLVDNPVQSTEEYRKLMFKMMKNLSVLDGHNKEGELQYYEFYEDDILHPSKISRHKATLTKVSDSE